MSKRMIEKEIEKLRQKIKNAPRIWKFHGRRVVNAWDWKPGDWKTLPDSYHHYTHDSQGRQPEPPEDWSRDLIALLERLEDPGLGRERCSDCAINNAQGLKAEIDRHKKIWEEQGGETAKEEFYKKCSEAKASEFRRHDAMHRVEWELYDEAAAADNRTCNVINYFKCPYGSERETLTKDGSNARVIWELVTWYDRHWHPSTTVSLSLSEMKWYHFNEPDIIDVTNLDDILNALEDGRIMKIIQEYERYMKETRSRW